MIQGRNVAQAALLAAAGGALYGAIGSASASGTHPVLRGAAISGVVSGVLALGWMAILTDPNAPQVGTGGAPLVVRGFP